MWEVIGLLIIAGIIAVPIAAAIVISRHSREIVELQKRQANLQAAIDWLVKLLGERDPAFTLPVQAAPAPPEPPRPHEIGVSEILAGPPKQTPQVVSHAVPPERAAPVQLKPHEIRVPELLAGPARQLPREGTQPVAREWWGDIEQAIGKRWMTWVGVLILIAAAAFAVKYMYEVGLLGPWVRVALELALGLLILFLGRYALRHRMVALGQGLLGLGLAVFYVTLYAAYYFHHLVSAPLELLLIAAVTAAGLLISVRYDALAVAVLSTLGGLITPELVSRGADLQHVLFAYILVLDLGVLAVALFKRWQILDMVAFVGTALIFAGWATTYYSVSLLVPTMAWLSVFYILFLLLPFVHSLRRRHPLDVGQLLLILVNAALMIICGWLFLVPDHQGLLGLITLLMALLYLLLAIEFQLRLPADWVIYNTLLALAIFCVTVAVPVLLRFDAITISWALEAPLLVLLGYYFSNRLVRSSGFLVLLVVLLRVLGVHLPLHTAGFTVFFNTEFGTVSFIPLGAAAIALIHYYFSRKSDRLDRSLKVLCGVGAGLLGLLLINFEISQWFSHGWTGTHYDQHYLSLITLMLIWVTGVALFMLAGIFWNSLTARMLAVLLVLVPVVLGVWTYEGMLEFDRADQAGYLLFANFRFVAALIAALLVMGLGWLHGQHSAELPKDEHAVATLLGIGGGLLGLLLVAGEIGYWWNLQGATAGPLLRASLSWQALVWAAGAALFLLAGLRLNSVAGRVAGVLPLIVGLITALRAYALGYAVPTAGAEPEYMFVNLRFVAALAVILAGFAYGLFIRRRPDICGKDEQQLATTAYIAADLLLLILLSSEVFGYCAALGLPEVQADQLAHLSLSVVWGVYALAFIVVGFWLGQRVMRLWALGLFGLTALKLLLIDLGYLEPAYRLLSTVVLGLLMIGTSYLYHRVEKQLQSAPPPAAASPPLA